MTLAVLAASTIVTQAANIFWSGGTADYTNATDWAGGVVPGFADNAVNDNGTNNVVRINVGNGDWTVNQIRAGNGAGSGAFVQNGQAVTLNGTNNGIVFNTSFRLGIAAGDTGVYTLNGGSINYSNGGFNVGESGTGILNINGGSITGSGFFWCNFGGLATPTAVTATMGGGLSKGDFTWFEQGFNALDGSIGLPAPGSTIVSASQADHSYTMAPSYTANDAVMIYSLVSSATISPTSPAACSALSFMGSAGNGPVTVNYTVHHADTTTETGSLIFVDWFGSSTNVLGVGGRVDALGLNVQNNGGAGNNPHIFSQDITLTNTTSAVTSIDLAYASGTGPACLLAVSSSTGADFTPMAITGYNEDMIVEAAAHVANTVTDVVNQTGGTITIANPGQFLIGNAGTAIYNLSGGSIDVSNYIAVGRSAGNGTFNMTGGTLNQDGGGGNLLVGTGFNNNGSPAVGVLNQSGGTINSQGQFLCPENSPSSGTYNLSGTGVLNVNNWIAIGRNGGTGILNLTNGSITHAGGGNFDIGAGGPGTVNQYGGAVTNLSGETWIGESSVAAWNLDGGIASLGVVHISQTVSGNGTLNVNGGSLIATELTTGNAFAVSTLTLNGGTLQASANTATFLHDIQFVNVSSGGAIFDSAGFNITVSQVMPNNGGDPSGGLTKNGLGTLTLPGANSYVGTTVVNAGTLATTTASSGAGGYTIADSAALGVGVVGALNSQLNAANLTLGTSTATSLNFDMGNFGNPSFAPLNVAGALAVNSTVTVNIADATPQLGQFPLIKYGSKTGSGSFVIGSLPIGVTAGISNNVANSSIDVVFTTVNAPRWEGLAGGNWDIGLTTNWINIGNSQPTSYTDGSPVVFDDTALGTTTVNLVATVSPSVITMNNSSLPYTFTGPGKISGNIGLTKQGTATLSILNTGGNNYAKPTVITAGTLSVTNLANGGLASPIGASSANPTNLVFAGGTFSYAGSPVSVNRGYQVTTTGSTIETLGDLTLSGVVRGTSGTFYKRGPGQLAYTGVASTNTLVDPNATGTTYVIQDGTVLLDGSAGGSFPGAQSNFVRNLTVAQLPGVNATIILTNTTLFGRVNMGGTNCTGTMIVSSNGFLKALGGSGNFTLANSPNVATPYTGVLTQNPGSTVDSDAELWVGQGPAGIGTYNMNGGTAIFRNWAAIGRNGGNGTFNMTGGTVTKTTANNFMIGSRDGTTGTQGTLNQSGGTILCGSEYWIGEAQNNASAAFGTNNISGTATLIVSNWIAIGREGAIGVLNLSGGSVTKLGTSGSNIEIGNGTGSSGTINQTGGAFTNTISETRLGTGAPGIWNMSGGTANLRLLSLCQNSGCTNGTLNLNGGILTATEIKANQTGVANVSTLNWNGGTIVAANGANANFLHNLTTANVLAGGANINTGTNIINIGQALLDGTGGGGLTKTGNGTLRLNGTNTYTGNTTVSAGTLGGSGIIAGPVVVSAGATLSPGASIGTLTVSNTLILAGGSTNLMELNATNTTSDLVTGVSTLTYGGTLVLKNLSGALAVNQTFTLFSAGTYAGSFSSVVSQTLGQTVTWDTSQLAPGGNGTVKVLTAVAIPVPITPVVSGGNLNLAWPSSQTGWQLQAQTNSLATGLSTNWVAVPGSTATNQVSFPINSAQGSVFFRLILP